jgi:hypothetical protein
MGKVILEFDSVEEQDDIQSALNGYKWKLAMWDLDQELRKTTKYGQSVLSREGEASELEQDIAEKYRELLREALTSYGLILD